MIASVKERVRYYFWATHRRKLLDKLLEGNRDYYRGIVLDLGGRDRGRFRKPKGVVKKWIFGDIEIGHNPDILIDMCDMGGIKDESIDVINAVEVLEHVEDPEKGLKECYRVLVDDGIMIISMPFLFPIHGDPHDFQRWTKDKLMKELKSSGFKIVKFVEMGHFFTVMMDMILELIKVLPKIISLLCKSFYPLMDVLVKLDQTRIIYSNQRLNRYTSGYFIIVAK